MFEVTVTNNQLKYKDIEEERFLNNEVRNTCVRMKFNPPFPYSSLGEIIDSFCGEINSNFKRISIQATGATTNIHRRGDDVIEYEFQIAW